MLSFWLTGRNRLFTLAVAALLTGWIAALAGCGVPNPAAPGAPARLALRLHWAAPAAASQSARVDSIVAEALGSADGVTLAGPVPLTFESDGGSFTGSLQVPSGVSLRVRVRAFSGGALFYQGVDGPLTVQAGQTSESSVQMNPALTVSLQAPAGPVTGGDSVDVTLVVDGDVVLRGIQADLVYDPVLMGLGRVTSRASGLSGYDAYPVAPGRLRLVFFDGTGSSRMGPLAAAPLAVVRFQACPSRDCAAGTRAPLALERVVAAGERRQEQPVAVSGASLRIGSAGRRLEEPGAGSAP